MGRHGQDVRLKFQNKCGTVVMIRTRGENGQDNTYHRFHTNDVLKKRKKIMTNAKKEAVLFCLNLLDAGMSNDDIREAILMDRIEVRPEVIEYYREVARCKKSGETVPDKPDFKALKVAAIQAENDARLKRAQA